MRLQRTGYRTDKLWSDIALGAVDGLEGAIWAYVFATIMFGGVLAAFLPLGLALILCGWAIASLAMVMLSKVEMHLVCTHEQSVIIFGYIGVLLVAHMGPDAATAAGLSTFLAVIAATSLLTAVCFFSVARLKITNVLGMVPYPVVCGYMAGIVWLLLDAGLTLAADVPLSIDGVSALSQDRNALKLAIAVTGGLLLYVLAKRIDSPWVLPASIGVMCGMFYAVATLSGTSHDALVAGGWLFDIQTGAVGSRAWSALIAPSAVDVGFVISVLPEIASIVFIVTLTTGMDVSILRALNDRLDVRPGDEMANNGVGLVICGLLCAPPAVTDTPGSEIYKSLGGSSRWMQIGSCAVLLAVVPFATAIIAYVPAVLVGAAVFLFVFQMFDNWVFDPLRRLDPEERAIILLIPGTVAAVGFVEGVLLGIVVTALLFVLRYSFVPVVHGAYDLSEYRSSVERSAAETALLDTQANQAHVLMLRGFLFFGTSGAVRDMLVDRINAGQHPTILLDHSRVTGIDGSALEVFRQIGELCTSRDVRLVYAGVPDATRARLAGVGAFVDEGAGPMVFSNLDQALQQLEAELLARHAPPARPMSIADHLQGLMPDRDKADLILQRLTRVSLPGGATLFEQGDPDDGLYILGSGRVSALLREGNAAPLRVRQFTPGALIGEMSAYSAQRTRTASIVADETSVLWRLDMTRADMATPEATAVMSAVHEMVARTMTARIDFMNRRLLKETAAPRGS